MKPLGKVPKWTPTLAYAIGLLATDGSLSIDGRHINFTSKDKVLVETFKDCLKLQNKIGRKARASEEAKKYYQIQFGNVVLYRWLLGIGLMPAKSKTLRALKIPRKYFADFVRGALDGDGSIRVYQDPVYPQSQRIYVMFFSASRAYLEWLQKTLESILKIRGRIREGVRVFLLTYAKTESLKLLPYVYYSDTIPLLRRKHILVENILAKQAEVAELARRATFRA